MKQVARKTIRHQAPTKNTAAPFLRTRQYDGEKLAFLIEHHGLNTTALSRFISHFYNKTISHSKIDKHCTGESVPHVDHLAIYAELFNVPLDYFLTYRNFK